MNTPDLLQSPKLSSVETCLCVDGCRLRMNYTLRNASHLWKCLLISNWPFFELTSNIYLCIFSCTPSLLVKTHWKHHFSFDQRNLNSVDPGHYLDVGPLWYFNQHLLSVNLNNQIVPADHSLLWKLTFINRLLNERTSLRSNHTDKSGFRSVISVNPGLYLCGDRLRTHGTVINTHPHSFFFFFSIYHRYSYDHQRWTWPGAPLNISFCKH